MRAALDEHYTAHLGIGSRSILIATPPKGRPIGCRVGRIEEGAIDGHEPIAPIKGTGHAVRLSEQVAAVAHQRLQALRTQGLASSAEARVADRAGRLARVEIAELADQALPHLALV